MFCFEILYPHTPLFRKSFFFRTFSTFFMCTLYTQTDFKLSIFAKRQTSTFYEKIGGGEIMKWKSGEKNYYFGVHKFHPPPPPIYQ